MPTVQVELLNFIAPHIFYVTTEVGNNNRTNFLRDLSARIQSQHQGPQHVAVLDEIVGVLHESEFVRGTIIESFSSDENKHRIFYCWLVDYGQLIKTDKIYKLPVEIQKATARCKAASLNNICYLKHHLEIGITGTTKSVPSLLPSSGVIEYCLDLLSNYDKLELDITEKMDNMLIGELVVHKKDGVYRLSKELCENRLATINEFLFQNLKYSIKEYMQTHLATIQQTSKIAQKRIARSVAPSRIAPLKNVTSGKIVDNFSQMELEEMDRRSFAPLENGRRRKLLSHSPALSTSSSDNEVTVGNPKNSSIEVHSSLDETNAPREVQAKPDRLQKFLDLKKNKRKVDQSCELNEIKNSDLDNSVEVTNESRHENSTLCQQDAQVETAANNSEHYLVSSESKPVKKSPGDARRKLMQYKKLKQITSACVVQGEQECNSEVNSSYDSSSTYDENTSMMSNPEDSLSPFSKSKQSSKLKGFFPAGMERSILGNRKKTEPTFPNAMTKHPTAEEGTTHKSNLRKSRLDDDCPTIKVPLKANTVSDEQLSPNDTETKTDEIQETNSENPKIFTKQDFCKLISGCTCVKCRMTLENDDWDAPLTFEKPAEELKTVLKSKENIIKPPRLLKSESETTAVQQSQILAIDYKSMSSMQKAMCRKLLVHGESIPIPIKHVANINIHREIYNNISKINYKESKRIQLYTFPSITRNQNVIMINDAQTGKTMAYLPILISFIMEKEERYSQLNKMGGGPIVVILCSNSKKCEEIYHLTWLISNKQKRKISLVTYPGYGNISNIDILITMPTVLSNLICTRATNFKRLCHLVLEDADVILKTDDELIKKFCNYSDQVLENRNCPKSIQLIVCAQHWTPEIENIVHILNKAPMVCIGNHLEAALYGKMKFTMQFLESSCKEQYLHKILKDTFKFTKSIIICNPDEIDAIQTFLTLKGIEFTSFSGVTQHEDILYLETLWTNKYPGDFSVLVCTDEIYNTLTITSVHTLIHFSLPYSWSQFIRRFSCLLENIQSPFDNKQRKIELSSFVLIDQKCETRMSKFRNFIKIAGLEKALPEPVRLYFQGLETQEENNRLAKKLELCEALKVFGKCNSVHCKSRHILLKDLDISDYLPQNGSIKFKIVKMITAASCSIKLLEHLDLNGKSVQKFEDFTDEINKVLSTQEDPHCVTVAVVSHLYLYKDKDQYVRCRVVQLGELALIYLMDKGIYCRSNLNNLFKMPEELKKIPPQCYEVQFAYLVPPYKDAGFSRLACKHAQLLVDDNCLDVVMMGTILLQIGMSLWIDDVYEYRVMHDKNLPSIGFQLTRELVKQGLAIKSKDSLERLYEYCRKAQIDLPEYKINKPVVKSSTKVEQVKPNWAFLDKDGIHEVTFTFARSPSEFYVRQNKFTKELEQLEESIQIAIQKPFYPILKDVTVGKCCLVRDEVNGQYARGYILNLLKEKAQILCVDYGDVVEQEISVLKYISNDLILKLPFQSIQCSMYGVKPVENDWCFEATDLLYRMAYEEDETTLRLLFIKISSTQENSVVKSQRSYSTIVKDGLHRRVLINQLLVDCGFALSDDQKLEDFELPELDNLEDEQESDIEEIERSDLLNDNTSAPIPDSEGDIDFSAFDCEIFNLADFMIDMKFPVRKLDDNKEQGRTTTNQLPAIKAAPVVDYLTPEVYWSQTSNDIKLRIKIPDVEDVEMSIRHNKSFQFRTQKEREYVLKLLLFDKVKKAIKYNILGCEVRVCLTKMKDAEWPRLLYTQEKVRKIYYDTSAINIEEETEERTRPLQLNISDSSSDDEAGPHYFVCSDLDSDYDFDIPNDDA